jgi:hypothetical protein
VIDDPFKVQYDVKSWKLSDKFGGNHGRIQVRERWGKYDEAPPVGEYNPDDEKKSRRELGPKYSFPTKPKDHYFEEVNFARKHPAQHFPTPFPDVFAPKKSIGTKKTFKKSSFQSVNLEDLRKCE